MKFDIAVTEISEHVPGFLGWEIWFTWFPVRVNNHVIWLENVERELYLFNDALQPYWAYRYRNILKPRRNNDQNILS